MKTIQALPPLLSASERMIGEEDLPVARTEIELSSPPEELELVNGTPATRKILALIRLHSQPLGTVVLDGSAALSWQQYSAAVWASMRDAVNAHLEADGLGCVDDIDALRAPPTGLPECVRRRTAVLADPPRITIVVATRERPDSLRDCLEALLRLDYPQYRIVVVDNDPETPATARLIAEHFSPAVCYVREDRRGLAAAHNRGLQEVDTEIVAFVDDDVVVDRHWLTGIAEGFAAATDVGCVSGLILPAELVTPAQLLLQRHGGYDKGFTQRIYDLNGHRPDDALFPFTAGRLGSGANMAFDTEILRQLGGFDRALGIGTFARGGDDLLAFFRVVVRHRLVYQPAAIIWHRHHREMAALQKQVSGYGVALGAFFAAAVAHEPRMWIELLRRLPRGLAFAFSPTSSRNRSRYDGLPPDMARHEMSGLLYGPIAYVVSRWRTRRNTPSRSHSPVQSPLSAGPGRTAVRKPDLIFDVGAHMGEDSEFYLKLGYRVVGVEANPMLAAALTERFGKAIDSADYTVVDRAVAESEGSLTFFVNAAKSVWGTADPNWAERNKKSGAGSEEITVKCVPFGQLIEEFGCPHYLKIDIEGADMMCVRALGAVAGRPKYVSLESTKTSWSDLITEFDVLEGLGYSRFKVVRQGRHRGGAFGRLDGDKVLHTFDADASGPFGDDLAGRWLTRRQAVLRYVPIFLLYKTIGDDTLLSRLAGHLPYGGVLNFIAGWYDTHARLDIASAG